MITIFIHLILHNLRNIQQYPQGIPNLYRNYLQRTFEYYIETRLFRETKLVVSTKKTSNDYKRYTKRHAYINIKI